MKKKKKERIIPMPTEEDKIRAKLKAAGSDPLVWAMKSVDDKFPDSREKDIETIEAESAVAEMEPDDGEDLDGAYDDEIDENVEIDNNREKKTTAVNEQIKEIKAEGKSAVPMSEGVLTVEVKPMRQNIDNVSPDEVQSKAVNKIEPEPKNSDVKKSEKKLEKKFKHGERPDKSRTQAKVVSMEPKQKKMIFAFAALIILALAGVTFGVVAVINQNNATMELANQLLTNGNNSSSKQVDDEYMNVSDWGMKIKIADNLTNVSFEVSKEDYGSIRVWGVRRDNGASYTPDFAKQSRNGTAMGTVVRVPRYERSASGRLIWYDDYYNYYYQGPSSEPDANETEMSWWVESYLLIKEMLTNADNYITVSSDTVGQQ